jgi:hypothetical protein
MTQGKKEGASPSGVRSLLTRSVPPSSSADRDLPRAEESGDHSSTRRRDGSGRRRPLHDGGRRHRAAELTSSPGVQDQEPNWSPDAPVDAQRGASSAEEKGSLNPTESEQRLSPRSLSSCRPLSHAPTPLPTGTRCRDRDHEDGGTAAAVGCAHSCETQLRALSRVHGSTVPPSRMR